MYETYVIYISSCLKEIQGGTEMITADKDDQTHYYVLSNKLQYNRYTVPQYNRYTVPQYNRYTVPQYNRYTVLPYTLHKILLERNHHICVLCEYIFL